MAKEIINTIERYLDGILEDEFHRYKSWDNCYIAFQKKKKSEIHTLQLAFFLASWGMYRGSGGLLQKNHLIHEGAVDIILHEESYKLRCDRNNEVSKENIPEILKLKRELAEHYQKIEFINGKNIQKPITPTDTLISKILLGTLCCCPAYDRYFLAGLKEKKMKYNTFDINSLNVLFDFIGNNNNKTEIESAQKLIESKTGNYYPVMKVLDMYFWQIGYEKESEDNKK